MLAFTTSKKQRIEVRLNWKDLVPFDSIEDAEYFAFHRMAHGAKEAIVLVDGEPVNGWVKNRP